MFLLLQFELMRVDIETCSRLSPGQTVCDVWHQSKLPKNCRVAMKVKVNGFWDLMLAAIDAADAAAPMNKGWRSLTSGTAAGASADDS
jgi:inosine-uridine nucleoside N-ribohydrolase